MPFGLGTLPGPDIGYVGNCNDLPAARLGPALTIVCRIFVHPSLDEVARFLIMRMMFGGRPTAFDVVSRDRNRRDRYNLSEFGTLTAS